MPQSTENNLLRFVCPACGIRLVVDKAIAGTEGPCPSCGARIIAPPLEVSRTLAEKQAAPVVIKPRGVSKAPKPEPEQSAPSVPAPAEPRPEPVREPVRRPRSVNPTTVLSEKHREQQDIKAFLKIMIAVVVVAAIALGVYYYMKHFG